MNKMFLCRSFVTDINLYAQKLGTKRLSTCQQQFLTFCVFSMVMLSSLNFAAFAVAAFGAYGARALSWMFHHSKIDWNLLLNAAVSKVLLDHNVSAAHIGIDDTDRTRSKVIKILWGVFKTFDKATGGWINAQNIVFLYLITDKVTVPIMFKFYRPDPVYSAWVKEDKKLRKKGIKKKNRPSEPKRNKEYPTRIDIARELLSQFRSLLVKIGPILGRRLKVKSILFDCAYLSPKIARFCRRMFSKVQVVSQIKSSQIVCDRSGKRKRVDSYFKNKIPTQIEVDLRGEKKKISFVSARLTVKSHGDILHIVALKYEGEEAYRYLAATQLTWRSIDIIRAYALRWLVEVVNYDWKQHDGWGRKAYQYGEDGARRGVILSLLVDYFLLTHPVQIRQSRAGLPLWTAGSVARRVQYDSFLETIEEIFASPDPKEKLKDLAQTIEKLVKLTPSTKHMVRVDIADLGPSPALQ